EASYGGTSFLTTDKLDDGFRYGSDVVDIVADATAPGGMGTVGWAEQGRTRAVRHGHVRLGRRGGRGGVGADRPQRHLRRLPLVAGDGAADRPPVGWRDAGRRLEPDPPDPDDEPELPAQAGNEPRRHRRRHRRRVLPRLEPVVVDRRPPAELPVRDRNRLPDQEPQEGTDLQEPDLHRHHLRVLAILRRGRRRIELRDARHAELGQGRARPERERRPCLLRGPVPERPDGRRQMVSMSGDGLNGRTPADILALAERVLRFARTESPTEVEVMAMADEGSLTRFANSEIHQNVAESNVQVNLRFVIGKRVGVASTNRFDGGA